MHIISPYNTFRVNSSYLHGRHDKYNAAALLDANEAFNLLPYAFVRASRIDARKDDFALQQITQALEDAAPIGVHPDASCAVALIASRIRA